MEYNEESFQDLQRHLCQTAIFYTADGYAYYAKIKEFVGGKIALLVPGAGQTKVIIRHPDQTFSPQGTSIIREEYTYVDLCTVVAVTSPLSAIPSGFALG